MEFNGHLEHVEKGKDKSRKNAGSKMRNQKKASKQRQTRKMRI
jgi:hypothetical protein